MSVHWPIVRTCLLHPSRLLIVDDQRRWTGMHLLLGAAHLAARIRAVNTSWTVGVLLPAGGAFPMAALASWMLGRTVVPLNFFLKPAELQYVVDDCECDTIISAGPMLEYLGSAPRVANLLKLDEMGFKGLPPLLWPASPHPDELAVLLYTSGTSGKPKGVMLSHANIRANLRQIVAGSGFNGRDVVLGVLPQFHSFGLTVLTVLPLAMGCKAVYSARFVPARIIKLFREHRPTTFVGIPSMFNALLHAKDAGPDDFASLRFCVSGGEPLPDAVALRFKERFGVLINEGYGLTETSPVTHWCFPKEYAPHSVGKPLPEVAQRIVDIDSGRELGPDQDGEVRLKGPNVMKGYYKLEQQTKDAFDEAGWFRTGDIGRLDERGRLFITGRLKEMIIVGGENVFPREIEEVLNRHDSVAGSGVIGVRDDVRGELPWAFVELKEGASFDEPALRAWCREHLAGYKVPREIQVIQALPRNATGKIMRRELAAMVKASASP